MFSDDFLKRDLHLKKQMIITSNVNLIKFFLTTFDDHKKKRYSESSMTFVRKASFYVGKT